MVYTGTPVIYNALSENEWILVVAVLLKKALGLLVFLHYVTNHFLSHLL